MSSATPEAVSRLAGKYLTFHLYSEEYGIEILKVREIIGIQEITCVPKVPKFVKGVINLRGRIIPIIDLRLKFGLPEEEYDKETCIIVVAVDEITVGVIVDTVSEVIHVTTEDVEEPPPLGGDTSMEFILGMAKIKERVVILMSVECFLSDEEVKILGDVSA